MMHVFRKYVLSLQRNRYLTDKPYNEEIVYTCPVNDAFHERYR